MWRWLAFAVVLVAPLGGCAPIAACFAAPACTAVLGAGLGYAASVNNLGTVLIGAVVGKRAPAPPAPEAAKP